MGGVLCADYCACNRFVGLEFSAACGQSQLGAVRGAKLVETENGSAQSQQSYEGSLISWILGRDVTPRTKAFAYVIAVILLGAFVGILLGRGIHDLVLGDDDGVYKILVTLAGAIGAPFVAWRTIIAHQQTSIAHQQAGIAREIHLTSLFTRAVEQLGATRNVEASLTAMRGNAVTSGSAAPIEVEPNLEVRLSAIYALERIAQDSERDHWPIMEVLCHYVRNIQNCGTPLQKPSGDDASRMVSWTQGIQPRADIQAAITAIGRRPKEPVEKRPSNGYRLDLAGANLQGITIEGNFAIADFSGVHLAGAEFRNCILSDAALRDVAEVDGLRISSSTISGFGGFRRFDNLIGVRFSDCTFERFACKGRIVNALFENCRFVGASFRSAILRRVRFEKCDLSRADFAKAEFPFGKLLECNLWRANFMGVDLSNVKLDGAIAEAIGDESTLLPLGVERPDTWRKRHRTN